MKCRFVRLHDSHGIPIIMVFNQDVFVSGLRYKSAAECFTNAQNAGLELRDVGLNPPTFTCIPVSKDKELKIYRQGSVSKFPF